MCWKHPDTKGNDKTRMKYWCLWNFNIMYNASLTLSVINTEPNKHTACILIIIMVALYNENSYPTDIIIFSTKQCLHCWAKPHLFPACLPPCPTWLTHFPIPGLLVFLLIVAAILKKMKWYHYTDNQPAYFSLQTKPDISMSDSGLRNIQLGASQCLDFIKHF